MGRVDYEVDVWKVKDEPEVVRWGCIIHLLMPVRRHELAMLGMKHIHESYS